MHVPTPEIIKERIGKVLVAPIIEEIAAGVHQDRRRVAAETEVAKEVACDRNAELGRLEFLAAEAVRRTSRN